MHSKVVGLRGGQVAKESVRPLDLQRTAAAIAQSYGDKGAIVISYGPQGIRIGAKGIEPAELREALCLAMHYSYAFEDEPER